MNKKRTSEKKGISLIVLVITIIVIIILAVAVILSIANNNPIENAKEARFRNDMKVIEEELNLYIAKKYADDLGTITEVVNLDGENMVSALPSTKDYKDKVKIISGNLELTGTASKEERDWAKKIGIEVEETVTLKLGDEVTYKGEPFYVIGGDTVGTISASTQDILLLAKYNLISDGSSQDTSGESNLCPFCYDDTKWDNYNIVAGDNLNNIERFRDKSVSVVGTAIAYGNNLGVVTGRLMTVEEAKVLQTNYSEILYGNKDGNKLNYWLGSAYNNYDVWRVKDSDLNHYYHYCVDLGDTIGYGGGVRPVIEVPKSSIN